MYMTKQQIMNQLAERNNGFLLTSDVVTAGISKTYLSEYVKKFNFERVAQGVYMSEDAWLDELYVIQLRSKEAVFSHETALYLHGLMEREPSCTTLTVNRTYNAKYRAGCSHGNRTTCIIHDRTQTRKNTTEKI